MSRLVNVGIALFRVFPAALFLIPAMGASILVAWSMVLNAPVLAQHPILAQRYMPDLVGIYLFLLFSGGWLMMGRKLFR